MIAAIFAWFAALLAMAIGAGVFVVSFMLGRIDYSRNPTLVVARWAGAGLFLLGLALAGTNIWELF
ncbi:hypothetical protein [Mesorhizobium sp. J428]|uniref:hypothetical protein n=1 Tax=Mesorhizobium sp. J428 TaxID=2898440 RepID=UPI002150AC8E|nr:hypothetical protein [Mesorhizobium sp. J428]MCR5855978.1 hypothetical protein [Mesorhizobium sp. J428]